MAILKTEKLIEKEKNTLLEYNSFYSKAKKNVFSFPVIFF